MDWYNTLVMSFPTMIFVFKAKPYSLNHEIWNPNLNTKVLLEKIARLHQQISKIS